MKSYHDLLIDSAHDAGSSLCIGFDPAPELVPGSLRRHCLSVLERLHSAQMHPAAFKPNIGYFHALDRPRAGSFAGSRLLADLIARMRDAFPDVPIILDAKRGDIARSSLNYAREAFDLWGADAVTVSPYMGDDSVGPFLDQGGASHGVYLLARTSNPGARRLQETAVRGVEGDRPLYRTVVDWARELGSGLVLGATAPQELRAALEYLRDRPLPLLIPGVGRQGGSATEIMATIAATAYPWELVRVNVSSGALTPWVPNRAPRAVNARLEQVEAAVRQALAACAPRGAAGGLDSGTAASRGLA